VVLGATPTDPLEEHNSETKALIRSARGRCLLVETRWWQVLREFRGAELQFHAGHQAFYIPHSKRGLFEFSLLAPRCWQDSPDLESFFSTLLASRENTRSLGFRFERLI
jgi:hypothetical protein